MNRFKLMIVFLILILFSTINIAVIRPEFSGNSFILYTSSSTGVGDTYEIGKTSNHRVEITFTGTITALKIRLNGGLAAEVLYPECTYTLDSEDIAAGKAAFTLSNSYVNFVQGEIVTLTGSGTVKIKYSKF